MIWIDADEWWDEWRAMWSIIMITMCIEHNLKLLPQADAAREVAGTIVAIMVQVARQ